jgi:hypothetical protein
MKEYGEMEIEFHKYSTPVSNRDERSASLLFRSTPNKEIPLSTV